MERFLETLYPTKLNLRIGLILDTEAQDPHSLPKFETFHFFENIWSGGYDSSIFRNYKYYIVFLEKYDFSPKSGKKPKFSFLPFFSKMIFLNIFHRILVKKIHFGRFYQVSGGGDTSDPRVSPERLKVLLNPHWNSKNYVFKKKWLKLSGDKVRVQP